MNSEPLLPSLHLRGRAEMARLLAREAYLRLQDLRAEAEKALAEATAFERKADNYEQAAEILESVRPPPSSPNIY